MVEVRKNAFAYLQEIEVVASAWMRLADGDNALDASRPRLHDDHAIAEDPERAVDAVTDEHPVEPPDPGGLLLEQHHELVSRLVGLEGAHHPLGTTVLASESPWTTALLTDRRGSRTRELEGLELQLHQRQLTIDHLHASLSWRVTAPLRTIVGRFRGVRA